MFMGSAKMGFRDIFRHKTTFCLFLIFLLSINIIVSSMFLSIYYSFSAAPVPNFVYSVVPISYDISDSDTEKITSGLNEVFNNGGYSALFSSYLDKKFNTNILVLLGKYEKNSDNRVIWAIPKNTSHIFAESFKDELGTVTQISPDSIDKNSVKSNNLLDKLYHPNVDLIKFESTNFKHLVDYKLSPDELNFIAENTEFSPADIRQGLDAKFENSFSDTFWYLHKDVNSNEDENNFIVRYVIPYILLLVVAIYISFTIFIQNLYQKMHKEYKIHLICGATKDNIFIRNSVFTFALTFANFFIINFLNNFSIDPVFFVNIVTSLLFIYTLRLINLIVLTKENLNISL